MLSCSRKMRLAIEAVLDIAYSSRPDPVQSKDIAARLGIPQRYLEPVMQQLVHDGVLRGVRGPKGGYTLARERRRITLGEVVRVVDALERAQDPAEPAGSVLGAAVAVPVWNEIEAMVLARLDATTLEDLCAQAAELGVPRGSEPADFTI